MAIPIAVRGHLAADCLDAVGAAGMGDQLNPNLEEEQRAYVALPDQRRQLVEAIRLRLRAGFPRDA